MTKNFLAEPTVNLTSPSDPEGIEKFNAACLDIGAQVSIVAMSQVEADYCLMGIHVALISSTASFSKFEANGKKKLQKQSFESHTVLLGLNIVGK